MATKHTTVFELVAKGDSLNGWPFKCRSREVFATRGLAVAAEWEFRGRCTDTRMLECADPETLKVTIVEREFVEEAQQD